MGTWKVNTTQYKFIFSLYKGEIVKILIFYQMPAPVFFIRNKIKFYNSQDFSGLDETGQNVMATC